MAIDGRFIEPAMMLSELSQHFRYAGDEGGGRFPTSLPVELDNGPYRAMRLNEVA